MARPQQPGLYDPLWYEATVAERFIVEMLDPDSGIQSVTMQAPGVRGIDDVVVKYRGRPAAYYQIKHTRVGDTLSFADLTGRSGGKSLLQQLADGWAAITRAGETCETHLFTNRELATHSRRALAAPDDEELPALAEFWPWIQETLARVDTLDASDAPERWRNAWQRWLEQLEALLPKERVAFLRSLSLDAGEPSLPVLKQTIIARLATLFGVPEETAQRALAQFDHHLREWATSDRGINVEVTAERAWSALALGETDRVGDHTFAPPAPFFPTREPFVGDVTRAVRDAAGGMVFLTGPAGCGKSSIVSALANRAEPVVDLRFHAFRPLTPHVKTVPEDAGRAVTAAALWGDLLVQLRTYFRGRLWAHRVPVRHDFLLNDPARLREHVLRLALVLAEERQRPTVIAIDGLDHAARARQLAPELHKDRLSLLSSLPPPDEIPPGIVFLVAGQPGWDSYPSWLLPPRDDVRVVEVPPIDAKDIATLLRAKSGTFPREQIDAAARIIAELTRGNTLAAVYAVAEAQVLANAATLQEHLKRRRLGASLEEYYSGIWAGALGEHARSTAVGQQLATALALSSTRLTAQLLDGFFSDARIGCADWDVILRRLAPVVDATGGTYAIWHNDLRVFLMAKLQADRRSLVAAARAMATHYLAAPASDAKHADLLRLLDFADQRANIPAVFSPAFVADAVALRRPIGEVLDQAQAALSAVTDITSWDDVHTLALGLATTQQARAIGEYYQLDQRPRTVPPYLVSEVRVLPRDEWSLRAIEQLCADARALVAAGERDRARAMMGRWLGGLSPVTLGSLLEARPGASEAWEHRDLEQRISEIVRGWGELAEATGVNRATRREPVTDSSGKLLATFYGGWLRAAVKARRPWARTLRMPPVWWHSDLEACADDLAGDDRWADVLSTLDFLRDEHERTSPEFRVRAAEWVIRAKAQEGLVAGWVTSVAAGGFGALTSLGERYDLELLDLYVGVAFAIGYAHSVRPSSAVSEEGASAYFSQYHDRRTEEHVRRLLYAAAWTGKLLRGVDARQPGEALLVQASELAAVVRSLLTPSWDKPAFVPPPFLSHAPRLIGLILGSLTPADSHVEPALSPVLRAYAAERRAAQPLEVVWRALAARGDRDLLEAWMLDWIGNDGRAWTAELGERFAIVQRFATLARETGWTAVADHAVERLRWNQLGYTGHKDYSLSLPLRWFDDLAARDATVWEKAGVRLLSISDEASRTGDNYAGGRIDDAVATAAARCGAGALWRLASATAAARGQQFVLGDIFALGGVGGLLTTERLRAEEICDLWCLAIGGLVWELDSGRTFMSYLRDAMITAAVRSGYGDVPTRLREIAPFEFALPGSDRGTNAPRREAHEELRNMPIDAAISDLVDRARSAKRHALSDVWRAVTVCAERLRNERPSNHTAAVQAVVDILQQYGESYTWSYNSFGEAVAAVLPLLPESERRAFRQWTVMALDTTDSPDIWLTAASENLRTLVRLNATTASVDQVRAGMERELCMHETWILGPLRENRRAWPPITLQDTNTGEPSSWAAVAFYGFVDLLASRSAAQCRAALKGLFALLATREHINTSGATVWEGLDRDRRYLLLALLERLATECPRHFAAWLPLVETELRVGRGAEQLQAWVTLDAFARATGLATGTWQLPTDEPHDHGSIIRVAEQLLDVPRATMGTVGLSRGRSNARPVAHRFAVAVGEDPATAEALVADHLNTLACGEPVLTPRARGQVLDGDMYIVHGEGVIETLDFLTAEVRAGCFGVVPPRALAQALLMNDEPRFFTTSGLIAKDPGAWPIDDALEALLGRGEGTLEEVLVRAASAGLADGEMLLAAELETYSRKHDVIFYYETGWVRDTLAQASASAPLTFNGRAHLLYGGGGYEPRQSKTVGWLTFRAGGLGSFVHANVSMMPAGIWRTFGWAPSVENPLVWVENGCIVARCEFIRGPIRNTVREYLHRQPVLLRWVVDGRALDAAAARVGMPFRTAIDVEVEAIDLD